MATTREPVARPRPGHRHAQGAAREPAARPRPGQGAAASPGHEHSQGADSQSDTRPRPRKKFAWAMGPSRRACDPLADRCRTLRSSKSARPSPAKFPLRRFSDVAIACIRGLRRQYPPCLGKSVLSIRLYLRMAQPMVAFHRLQTPELLPWDPLLFAPICWPKPSPVPSPEPLLGRPCHPPRLADLRRSHFEEKKETEPIQARSRKRESHPCARQ
ncbi:hypothetical protein BDA96_10G326900 [Sorghum bicolor]|uniref:Uncharacterized protein n=1 Tax=Sorghum bicolor TaxID=4558 RepID=A0A921U2W2_SORBI|nr:hypothetical protein BDA96_10G326900 [Sorghum bicolor]